MPTAKKSLTLKARRELEKTVDMKLATKPRSTDDSMTAQITALERGQSWSRVERMSDTTPLGIAIEQIGTLNEQLRNRIKPAVKRAGVVTGRTYSIELSYTITSSAHLYIVAIVTAL